MRENSRRFIAKNNNKKRRVAFFRKKMEMPFDPFFSPSAFRKKQ
jgi:hypothetical protein